MKRIALVVLTVALAVNGLAAQDLERLFKAAVTTETVDRNCRAAIEQYKVVAAGKNRELKAQALLRMAGCYKQLNDLEWRRIDQDLIANYGDQKAVVEQAQKRLGVAPPRETVQRIWSRSNAGGLTVSPNGRYIVESNFGQNSLVVHDLSSATDRTVALGDGEVFYPLFITPDSKRVLYTWSKSKNDVRELRIVNLDGTGMRSLISDSRYWAYDIAGVSADGKLAAVGLGLGRNETWQIGLLSLATKDLRILKNQGWRDTYVGNFSPDGRWLVYSAQLKNESPDKALYVIATDGSAEPSVVVPSGLRDGTPPRFTPDGSRVVFVLNRSNGRELWSVRVKDGKRVGDPEFVKPNPGGGLGFSLDGTYYYLDASRRDSEFVVQVDPSTWKPKNAPAPVSDPLRSSESLQSPHWSADGKRLAYVAGERVVIHDFDSGQDRELPAPSSNLRGWLADGKSLQVAVPAGLRLIDTETQQERLIPTGTYQTVASTDGKAVFYATFDSAPYEQGKKPALDTFRIKRRDLDSEADEELYRAEATPSDISVMPSPDGRSLAFAFTRPGEKQLRLWILPLSGGEPKELPGSENFWPPSSVWTQDSRAILFVRSDEIWVQPIDGRQPYGTGITFSRLSTPNVSPDGSRIAFRGGTTITSVWTIKNLFPDTSAAKR
jgi:Tol biopolymer transport system component